ncbi:DUF2158 domain-containing protein [Aeromonas enterica]
MQRFQYFYPGQVVTLSSGGQRMTVKPTVDDSDEVYCTWFNLELGGEPVEWAFPSHVLRLEENQEPHGYAPTRFEPGQVAQLRSGGPSMTVLGVQRANGMSHVTCIWLDKDNRNPLSVLFPSETLIAAQAV